MLFLMSGAKKEKKAEVKIENLDKVKEIFRQGRFPVVTTEELEGKTIGKMLGLVACRGYDADDAFFGMATRAVNKGAQAIIGYNENVAFHPDGSKFFSCYGTAIQYEKPKRRSMPIIELTDPIA